MATGHEISIHRTAACAGMPAIFECLKDALGSVAAAGRHHLIDLWTEGEGRSDLALGAEVSESETGYIVHVGMV